MFPKGEDDDDDDIISRRLRLSPFLGRVFLSILRGCLGGGGCDDIINIDDVDDIVDDDGTNNA
jgi:hypothetical protein